MDAALGDDQGDAGWKGWKRSKKPVDDGQTSRNYKGLYPVGGCNLVRMMSLELMSTPNFCLEML